MDLTHIQDPFMEDHGLQIKLLVVEIEAIDNSLQWEVIIFYIQMFFSLHNYINVFWIYKYFQVCFISFLFAL